MDYQRIGDQMAGKARARALHQRLATGQFLARCFLRLIFWGTGIILLYAMFFKS